MKAYFILLAVLALIHTAIVQSTYKYVIVGAGFAGLGACRTLTAKGVTADQILVIEAKNRTGGRCATFTYGGVTTDLGAAFMHNPSASNPLHTLANSIPVFSNAKVRGWFGNQTEWWYANKSKVSSVSLNSAKSLFNNYINAVKATYNNDYDSSLATVLNSFWKKNPNAAGYNKDKVTQVLKTWAIENGAELTDQSAWEYQPSFDYSTDIDYTFTSSLSAFHSYLWTNGCKATLSLGEKVTLVDSSGTTIKVTTDKNTYSTNKLMLSPSLGILKAGLMTTPPAGASIIRFNPALPADKKNSINAIGFGKFEKLYVTVSKPFWDSNSSTLRFTCRHNASCNFTEAWVTKIPNTFLFFIGGNAASFLANRNLTLLRQDVTSFLGQFLTTVPNITNIFMTNWANDPNVLGGYSYASVNITDSAFNNLRKVWSVSGGSIWFIGEATPNLEYSYAYGAYNSGVNAANAAYTP